MSSMFSPRKFADFAGGHRPLATGLAVVVACSAVASAIALGRFGSTGSGADPTPELMRTTDAAPDPCLLGTWKVSSQWIDIANPSASGKPWPPLTSSGGFFSFTADGKFTQETDGDQVFGALTADGPVKVVSTGKSSGEFISGSGVISYRKPQVTGTTYSIINGIKSAPIPWPVLATPDRYSCKSDTLQLSPADPATTTKYGITLAKIR